MLLGRVRAAVLAGHPPFRRGHKLAACIFFKRVVKSGAQPCDHAHSVFQLRIVLVKIAVRDGQAGIDIPLVRRVEHAGAALGEHPVARSGQLRDDGAALRRGEGADRRQTLAIFRQADRHGRHADDRIAQRGQIRQRAIERRAVVVFRHEQQLALQLQPRLGKTVEDL